jgi:hypothetical protein
VTICDDALVRLDAFVIRARMSVAVDEFPDPLRSVRRRE